MRSSHRSGVIGRASPRSSRARAASEQIKDPERRGREQRAIVAVLAGLELAEPARDLARKIEDATSKAEAFLALASALLGRSRETDIAELANEIVTTAETTPVDKDAAFCWMMAATLLGVVGDGDLVIVSFLNALLRAGTTSRGTFLDVLHRGAPVLSGIASGQILWPLHEDFREVDMWWTEGDSRHDPQRASTNEQASTGCRMPLQRTL